MRRIAALTVTVALGAALAAVLVAAPPVGTAWAQANLRPDPTPRIPPQPGQSLPLEDRWFLGEATATSQGQIDLAALMAEKAAGLDAEVRDLAQAVGETHRTALDGLKRLTQARHADAAAPAGAQTTDHGKAIEEAKAALKPLSGEDLARHYVQEQLRIHDRLADLYQTESSNTPDRELATFAITTLVPIQRNRDALRRMAGRFGIDPGATGQPVQYGDPAKAR